MPNGRRAYGWVQIEAAESGSVHEVGSRTRTCAHAVQQRRPSGRKTRVQRIQTGRNVVRLPAVRSKKGIHRDLPLQRYAPAESRPMPHVTPTRWPPFRPQIVRIGRQSFVVVLRVRKCVVAEQSQFFIVHVHIHDQLMDAAQPSRFGQKANGAVAKRVAARNRRVYVP